MSSKKQKKERPENPAVISKIERNTLTLSLVVVILGLFCLPNIEKQGDTWYVLMLVFALNIVLLAWILYRIFSRINEEKKNSK